MNAEDFYEEFKEALRFLGPGWAGKKDIKIKAKKGRLILSFGSVKVTIFVNNNSEK